MPDESDASWWHGTYEERMERRALRRASPEFKERIEAIARRRRHREIWSVIKPTQPEVKS
jgi:hypothetical protein